MEPQIIHSLLEEPSNVCVSIFMPMFPWGREVQQNEIRFRNLIKDAAELLEKDRVCTSEQGDAIIKRLNAFADNHDHEVWRHAAPGLAVFVTPDGLDSIALGNRIAEQVHVGERFYLRPLLPALHSDGQFVLLAVSQNQVRLFEGSRDALQRRASEDLPDNLRQALGIDEYRTSLQHFSYAQGGDVGTMYHGHGAGEDDHKANILQFFHRIDGPLNAYLNGRSDPLVFAGVEYLFPIFKEVVSYPHLLPDCVSGNFDDTNPNVLLPKAWEVVEPYFREKTSKAIAAYHDAYGQNRATADLETILMASEMGAIETLLIRDKATFWGHLDRQGHIQEDCGPNEDNCDLLDDAAVETLKHGGDVFVVAPEAFPATDCSVVAQLRFDVRATSLS